MNTLLPWILASLSLAILLAAGVLWALGGRAPRKANEPLPTQWTLSARPVFSSDERRVYRHLREALPHHVVLSKLPLVRFCQPSDPRETRYWYQLLGTQHVSFAICSPNGRVLAALDLETDRQPASQRSLQIKQSVLRACKVRYLRCAPDQLPPPAELQLLLPQTAPSVRGPQPAPTSRPPAPAAAPPDGGATARRRERVVGLWTDSGFLQDSFFGVEGGDTGASGFGSGFGALGGPETGRRPGASSAGTGVVENPPRPPLRH